MPNDIYTEIEALIQKNQMDLITMIVNDLVADNIIDADYAIHLLKKWGNMALKKSNPTFVF